jgi:hypothetical protein
VHYGASEEREEGYSGLNIELQLENRKTCCVRGFTKQVHLLVLPDVLFHSKLPAATDLVRKPVYTCS